MDEEKKKIYIEALKHLIELNGLNKALGGKSIFTPTLLSENICRDIMSYDNRKENERDHDALEGDKKIEIKATSSSEGVTTINMSAKVAKLLWLQFDYDEKIIIFNEIEYDLLKKEIKKKESKVSPEDETVIKCEELYDKKRKTITLSKYSFKDIKRISMYDLSELNTQQNHQKENEI